MKRLGLLCLIVLLPACETDQTGPRPPALQIGSTSAADPDAAPDPYPFGPDSYRRSGPFAGAPVTPLVCQEPTGSRATYDGDLVSAADNTTLDARLEVPGGTPPSAGFPLVTLIHGYAGSKTGSGDIASKLLDDGYAVLRYSTRGFGQSWGQVNLADLNLEIADLQSMIGRVMDDEKCHLDPNKVVITGASYGGGHSWLSLVDPEFPTPSATNPKTVHIVAVAPIAPWTDLFYSLLPNGRPNESPQGFGGLKTSFVNGLYVSGFRRNPARPYPNYPDYFMAWHAWLNITEPNPFDPIWHRMRDGIAGYRSIWWQQEFWNSTVHMRIPIFQVQGFTDDLFPLTEAKRMLIAINKKETDYPITSYFGDVGHPRASNKPAEINYIVDKLLRPWLTAIIRDGAPPKPKIYASRTKLRGEPFDPNDVLVVDRWDQLWIPPMVTKTWTDVPRPLVNPVTFAYSGILWDPFVMEGAEQLKEYAQTPPTSRFVSTSYASYKMTDRDWGGGSLTISGQPTVAVNAFVTGHRVQLNVRLIDEGGPADYLITRGTYTFEAGRGVEIGRLDIVIPTYGNYWTVSPAHRIRLEISNVDSPYLTPSREPSTTTISSVKLELPVR